jgi:hypothetical protein
MDMRATSKIIAEFVSVFVIGAAAGALLMYCYTDTQLTNFMSHTTDPDNLVARINKKYSDTYHLTPDEIAKIQPQIKEMSQKLYQERHQFGVDIVSTFADYHKQIADQLTPEHKDAYVKAVGDRDAKLKALLLPDQASPQQGGK